MKNTTQFLTEALDLIQKGWTKSYHAKDVNGKCVFATAPEAVSFCAAGAVVRAIADNHPYGSNTEGPFIYCLSLLKKHIPVDKFSEDFYSGNPITNYNDNPTTTKEDIVNLFQKAIEESNE